VFPLYLKHRLGDEEFFREIQEKGVLFLPEIKLLIVKISFFYYFFENSRIWPQKLNYFTLAKPLMFSYFN